ncbi:phosphate/phosphite/phosphonate ABC transporter substrate-binding protein [Roseococcus sp. SDR]|uniref:phosphate/phosphite/phosphonate ABC transporter substrate-binding protein n=1 Tax=Roseococcus sp. SDR TaxID=2835532 RepID=UPI001BCD75C8|nr:phosphate/phosphite/phosphonate ABC transporter substrate-binding protein [Roseococcus sp. SDR]MBS7792137.1 phosphate/phosphite/phosphonate ABC transporter substrate-binding protein [Roseococcus sp. SDR]MBV1847451.1 phosphate/phosphite/phosphonate ABC transporter substrate-binding protein [Roseococcus sp. SDR]
MVTVALARRGLLAGGALLPLAAQAEPAGEWRPRRTADGGHTMPEPGRRAWAEQVPAIRVGLMGGENEADRLGRFDGLRRLLEETFRIPVRLMPASDYAGVMQALSAKQIEFAALGPSIYAAAWIDTQGGVEPILTIEQIDGSTSYVSVMLVRADSGITNLEQMRGRSLAWADPNSASGYLIPRFELRRAGVGVEPGQFFGRTGFGGGHEQAVVAMLQRQYDAAMTWASGVGDIREGFSRGNTRAMVEKGMLRMSDVRIIWQSRPIQNGPITMRTDVPAEFREDIIRFYLALPQAHPAIFEQIGRGTGAGFREARHADYEVFVEMRREEAAARRRRS